MLICYARWGALQAPPKAEAPDDGGGATAAPSNSKGGAGRSLESETLADVTMENVVEKLKLLNYERDFCRAKRPHWTPLTRQVGVCMPYQFSP
jgi:hypothetical protein